MSKLCGGLSILLSLIATLHCLPQGCYIVSSLLLQKEFKNTRKWSPGKKGGEIKGEQHVGENVILGNGGSENLMASQFSWLAQCMVFHTVYQHSTEFSSCRCSEGKGNY